MPRYQRAAIHSSDDIRAIADHVGSHFFSADTMRYWGSRLLGDSFPFRTNARPIEGPSTVEGNRYAFITSERAFGDESRRYAVRVLTLASVRDDRPAVSFDTLDRYDTPREARMAAQIAASEIETA
jgi:hypothetical protein